MDMTEEPSGYTANFIGDVADYLKCKICMMVLKDPLMLVDCGHKFCSCCFDAMKTHTTSPSVRCPVDRGLINNIKVFPDKAIKRVILDLYVKCDHYQDGCLWSGELRKLATHLEEDCICEDRKKNSLQLKQHKERIKECERSLEVSARELANIKTQNETSTNILKDMINDLQYQFTDCNRQLQETQTELEFLKQQHKQCHLDASQIQVSEGPFTVDNEVEISSSSNEVAVAEVTSTQSDGSGGVGSAYLSKLRKRKLLANDENEEESSEDGVGSSYRSRLRNNTFFTDEDDQPLIELKELKEFPKVVIVARKVV